MRALGLAADLLGCPVCTSALEFCSDDGDVVVCGQGHSFDVARQGYVSLLAGAGTKVTGDTADMLAARAAFQGAGHFDAIADAVVAGVPEDVRAVAEIGAGTGFYLANVLDGCPDSVGVGLDIAKPAARRCAKAHPRAAAVVADVWRKLPLRTGALDAVLSVFAPRNPAEAHRVLAPGGIFVVVTPTPRHLAELVARLGMVTVDEEKPRRLDDSLAGRFRRTDRRLVEYPMKLSSADIEAVVAMGPSAHHLTPAERATRIADLPADLPITASVTVATYLPV